MFPDDVLSNVDGSAHPRDAGSACRLRAYYRERLVCDGVDVDDADGIFDELVLPSASCRKTFETPRVSAFGAAERSRAPCPVSRELLARSVERSPASEPVLPHFIKVYVSYSTHGRYEFETLLGRGRDLRRN